MTYAEKLKDPRWQKKRLEIMQRDYFTCRICETTTETLTVHHIRYISGYEPWNYSDELLITLCEDCHDFVHERGRWDWITEYEKFVRTNTAMP